ncbi:hypothetical protein MPTK1_4g21460 [Marchantia polymorpha subsp. ruderalis]|uniref:NAD-dependent epimerase/dehydratase domain-containing protein n=2 Tax=Marchantia polymorpha TaxID=3197 RepID=A0AAF6BCB1_MARPO|nr:hypothetical protein MARPO_0090s0075 [Marchantia polymorpha]BBN09645.1 hypothetical protein Mp_4g21460 [Marchantia polymorpha subsp. ruderalis]|eukprot:PTQ33341.1 hypothetical protein MARPO_0090s0075 [Marchantia polymorpha]
MASTTSAACCVSSAFASAAAQAVPKNGALAMAAIPPRSNSSRLRLDCRESSRVQSVVLARPKFVPSSVAVRRTKKFLAGVVAMATAETVEKNALDESSSFTPSKVDLLVVGPGVLGSLVAQQWFKVNEGECNVVGQTNSTNRHEELRSLGIIPVAKDASKGEKFPNVIFCAPPSGSADYAAEVRAAAERWNGEGCLLFTSSSALYAVSDNGVCDEETAPIVPKGAGPRTDRLHGAEEEVLKVGGNVVRLAGLYTLERGAHSYYLSQGTIAQRPDHIVNLIHYEDAASLCVAILRAEHRGQIFLGCDNHPVSRQEIMDAVNKSGKYDKKFEGFTSSEGPLGKRMNNNRTRRMTGWEPKYESFPSFLGVTL